MNEVEKKILKYLDKNNNNYIFDIGCFRGNFTNNLLKHENKLGPKSNFFLFDPNPKTKIYLNELLKNDKIKYSNFAIDNTNSSKKFYLNKFFESSGSSLQTTQMNDKKWKLTRQIFMQILQPYKKVGDFVEINVETKTLDSFCNENNIDHIDLLKIDAEGNEFNILLGSEKLLINNKINIIYI